MAATMHAKMNRRKLDQIDIIRICEEILNPSVPMALRLSGILMGGVVIVYERKVRLLYDDVNRLLVEINSAWKVKPAVDPTVLPKGKNQAKFEAVTLPENNADVGDVEQSIDYSNKFTGSATFQQSAFFAMRLDTIDELTESFREKEPDAGHHQAEPANITLDEPFHSFRVDTGLYNRFERFDIEGDEETQNNFPSQGYTEIPPANVHSPPPEMEQPQKDGNIRNLSSADDTFDRHPVRQADQSSPELREAGQQPQRHLQKRKPARKKSREAPCIMDNEQTMIPSNLYQTWLQDSVDIRVKRPKITEHAKAKSAVKLAKLVDLPPVALSCGLFGRNHEVYYPKPLLNLWITSMQPLQDSPSGSGRTNSPHPPEPSSSSPPHGQYYQDPPEMPMGDVGNRVKSNRIASQEKLRSNVATGTEIPINEFNLMFNGVATSNPNAAAANSGTSVKSFSVPSPGPGLDFLSNTSDSYSERLRKKRPSSTKFNSAGLESLDEENQWIHEAAEHNLPGFGEPAQPSFKIPRHSRHGPTPDHELLIETGTTQTQRAAIDEEAERMASNITTHLKTYFETPGAPQTESLNQLAFGMNRKQAAQLFYQTCVLVTRDVLRVQQTLAYGDITISRGAKM
ncbi:hypothetical protein BVRB_2g045640 [Beta vulgaris subsp. vulgaris]|uniref:Sister chromatid cohesion 1 protein 1 n=1 Tax=Beta vulgaris subsp. vulgaris TaxID=3555 RepID=A0A0J8E877_BETVV|nr:hypothetical protein BVRB_2g045640 [Beta vulgaris subsp. vulgaris]